jgi:pantothenate kinase-related protein Tda10
MALFLLKNKDIFYIMATNHIINFEKQIENFKNLYNYFNGLFSPLYELEKYDKLQIYEKSSYQTKLDTIDLKIINTCKLNFEILIDKYNIYQPVKRWLYDQSRANIFNKLNILFSEYNLVMVRIKNLTELYPDVFKCWLDKYNEMNNKIIKKLIILGETYNDEEIHKYINNYIKQLN